MSSVIEMIKEKVDIVEEVGLVVALHKSGRSYKGLCPFHNERTPSFYVFAETRSWHCFGCNEGGDVFSFVQKQQGMEFPDALSYLAEKAGVSLEVHGDHSSEEEREAGAARERLRKLNEEALLWFHQRLLRAKDASQARDYVQSRGVTIDTVITFALGYAPDQWDALSTYLVERGYSERELVMAGLAREREQEEQGGLSGRVYDYFRNRLIFPIRDTRGRVIGFGGRALGDGKPKYLNSPQTILFEKNSVLYGIDLARDAIKQASQVVIVEGYVDAIIAHQYGSKQTVACIGSAITEKHIQQLKKLTRQVTLALDPDAAGSAATEHGIQEALKTFDRTVVPVPLPAGKIQPQKGGKQQGIRGVIRLEEQVDAEINIVQLPAGEDPDEFIRRDFAAWLYAVAHPLPLVDYYFVVKTMGLDLREPVGKAEAAKRLLPVIAMVSDRIKRDAYIRKLAMMISSDERSLYEELQKVVRKQKLVGVEFSSPNERPSQREPKEIRTHEHRTAPGLEGPEKDQSSRNSGSNGNGIVLDRQGKDKLQWEDYLIGLLLQNPGLNGYVCGIITDSDFAGTDTRELYHILNSVYQQQASSSSHQPFEQIVPSALLTAVERAKKRVELGAPKDEAALIKAAIQCATRLKRSRLLQLNTELKYLLQEAVATGDTIMARQLDRRRLDIYQQLRTIDTATSLHG